MVWEKKISDRRVSQPLKSASMAAVGTWLSERNPGGLGHLGLCVFGTKIIVLAEDLP